MMKNFNFNKILAAYNFISLNNEYKIQIYIIYQNFKVKRWKNE